MVGSGPAGASPSPFAMDWQTRANRDKLEALIKEQLEFLRRSHLYNRLRRIEALEKAREEVEPIHDLGSPATRQRLEVIFYQLRLARQGR